MNIPRRDFITLLGGATAWPLVARAQQPAMPVIGFLGSASQAAWSTTILASFHKGLSEGGYIEGRNVAIEYRWAEGRNDRFPSLAADLVKLEVALIVAAGATIGIQAALAATRTIPIVFVTGADPVESGLVASLNRPGGNATGVSAVWNQLAAKQLELLRELVPGADPVAVLVNPTNPPLADAVTKDVQAAARDRGWRIHLLRASADSDIDAAFATATQLKAGALLVGTDAFFLTRVDRFVSLAARHALPAIYSYRQFPQAGGLMSYGTSLTDTYVQVGIYTARILKGAKPAELPVMQPTRFDFVINARTAKALGLKIPLTLQVAADEVIE